MRLSYWLKRVSYVLMVLISIFLVYFSVIFIYQSIDGYAKSSWYYQYNLIEYTNPHIQGAIGASNHEMIENQPLFYMTDFSNLDLIEGKLPTSSQEILITQTTAVEWYNTTQVIGKEIEDKVIVGIINDPIKRIYTTGTLEECQSVLMQPQQDMEKLDDVIHVSLNHQQEVRNYVENILNIMKITVILSFVMIAIVLVFIKLYHFKWKETLLLHGISFIFTFISVSIITNQINQYLTNASYLYITQHWIVLAIVSVILLLAYTMIKKLPLYKNKSLS